MVAPHWHPGVDETKHGDELTRTCMNLIQDCEHQPAIPVYIVRLQFSDIFFKWFCFWEVGIYPASSFQIWMMVTFWSSDLTFQVLLGTRYGWRPPPSRIAKREFEFLVRHLRQIDINGPVFIRNWYEEDKNTDPSFCVLKERGLIPDDIEVWHYGSVYY